MPDSRKVIAITDDEALAQALRGLAADCAFEFQLASATQDFDMDVTDGNVTCVILDATADPLDLPLVLTLVGQFGSDTPVIVIVSPGEIRFAVKCMLGGAFDVIEQPWHAEELSVAIGKARRESRLLSIAAD